MATGMTSRTIETRGDWWRTARWGLLWPVSILIGFPIGGYVADLVVDGVDSVGAALAAGLIGGVIIGAAEWFALRRWAVSWLWIPATAAGLSVGLAAGATLVDHGIGRGDLALMGAVTGLSVGVMQALVLAQMVSGAWWWAIANPPGWALGWLVSSYVIARNIGERFPVFGASGALVFGLLTWLVLATLFRATALDGERTLVPTIP